MLNKIIKAIELVPEVKAHLSPSLLALMRFNKDKLPYKSQDYFLRQIQGLVRSLYGNAIGGEFIDTMANLISGQLYDAYRKAWEDYGETGELPQYLEAAWQEDVLAQYDYVDQYYRDIVDARIDETPIDPLLARANLWANRWSESYNKANTLIQRENGGNLIWVYGETEHCDTCRNLNGIVASAAEWETFGVRPQNAPNRLIQCGGWNCKCQLLPTTQRRSRNAGGKIGEVLLAYGR